MLAAFWESVGEKLADRWATVGAPAVVFWAGGLLAWAYAGSGWSQMKVITDWLNAQDVAGQLAGLIGALVVVAASVVIVQRLTLPVLRLVEGYWPSWLGWLARRRRKQVEERRRSDKKAYQQLRVELEQLGRANLSAEQSAELARVEQRLLHEPALDNELLPTRVGNLLRSAETRPWHRYGLEATWVWPRLWMVLPDSCRAELAGTRGALDRAVAAAIWGAAFVGFTPLAWWALPAGIATAVTAVWWWVPARAAVFADLVEAAFDLYRSVLYVQLRWPLPATPADEVRSGRALTEYLVSGSDAAEPKFTSVQ
jgi:hypothetical protein